MAKIPFANRPHALPSQRDIRGKFVYLSLER